nr:immunoglobulin light chain junction region [Macaca mulatta]MOW12841.1 immunoglobulin light chain junction region [Macaca mulatta]
CQHSYDTPPWTF